MAETWTYLNDNELIQYEHSEYPNFVANISPIYDENGLNDARSKHAAKMAFHGSVADLNMIPKRNDMSDMTDKVWMNGSLVRTDYNIATTEGQRIKGILDTRFPGRTYDAHALNLVSEFQANRPPYVNDSISWYNFEEPSKELKTQYGLNYTRFRYQPWYGLKFDLTTEEISLKVVLWRDQLPGAYDDNLPEDPRGDSFVARIHDSSGNVSPWCDYYINTSDIHIKEWCDEHGLTFPYDYDNKTIRDKVWIWGIVFNFDTGEVTHVKAYERNYN